MFAMLRLGCPGRNDPGGVCLDDSAGAALVVLRRVVIRTDLVEGDSGDESACVREVLAAVTGYGPLQAYLDDPTVEELWINRPDRVFRFAHPTVGDLT